MTSSWNAAKAEEDLQKNPYFDKYAGKIKALQQNNKEEYLSRLQAQMESKVKKPPVMNAEIQEKEYPTPRKAGEFHRRELKEIMNLDLLKGKSAEEIAEIWKEYYRNKEDVIFGHLPKKDYSNFAASCRLYPTFIIPLPRGDGYEFFMTQFFQDEFHLTPLILYQKYKEESPESLRITYFSELPQDLVLFLGEYDKKMISSIEAQCLLNALQLFYSNSERLNIVKTFNECPESFDYNVLLREINSLSLVNQ